MMQSIYFDYKFTTLNEYINAERSNKYAGAKIKKSNTEYVYTIVKSLLNSKKIKKIDKLIEIRFIWHETSKMRDPDNISFCKKYILDGMVSAGLIKNDGHKQIVGFTDRFIFEKMYGVEVILQTV